MLEVDPNGAEGMRSLAKFYLNTKREKQRAEELAAKAVRVEPTADSFFVLGWAKATNGKRTEALGALREALRRNPKNRNYQSLFEAVRRGK